MPFMQLTLANGWPRGQFRLSRILVGVVAVVLWFLWAWPAGRGPWILSCSAFPRGF
jgi:hypothetical protein